MKNNVHRMNNQANKPFNAGIFLQHIINYSWEAWVIYEGNFTYPGKKIKHVNDTAAGTHTVLTLYSANTDIFIFVLILFTLLCMLTFKVTKAFVLLNEIHYISLMTALT